MTVIVETNGEEVVTPTISESDRLKAQRTRFISIMSNTFGPDSHRMKALLKLYESYGDRLIQSPASSKMHYHNAYSGGYIDHVLNVYDSAMELAKTLKRRNGSLDFTKTELTMAALHHDLWKLGMPGGQPYYIVQDSDWHRNKLGEMFKLNEYLPYMKVTDGSLFVLQLYGIELTFNEWISIKLSDGLYDESNKSYLMNHGKFPIHSNLPYVIHWADHMSCTAERDVLKQEWIENIPSSEEEE